MSESYQTQLVDRDGTTYQQFALGVTAGSFAAFVLAAGALFGWVPVAEQISGVTGATYLGAGIVGLGLGTAALGVFSRWGDAETTPNRSAGLVVGLAHTVIWLLVAGLFLSYTVGIGTVGWLLAAGVGVGAGYLTIALREDLGASLPTAAFVVMLGLLFVTGVISPGWGWQPNGTDATIPGTLVIPLMTMFGSLMTGWASASAYEGFGTRGRQNGAFVLISLVVMLTLSVLVFLLAFVFERGIMVVLENLTLSAGTVIVSLATALFVILRTTTIRPTVADGTDKIIAFVSLAVTTALALGILAFVFVVGTNLTLSGSSITVEPTAAIGAVPGLIAAGIVLALTRESGEWNPGTDQGQSIKRAFRAALVVAAGIGVVELLAGLELAAGGIAAVTVILGGVVVAVLLVAAIRPTGTTADGEPGVSPPVSWVGRVTVLVFLIACLRVFATGFPMGIDQFGIVAKGTIDWPFITNPSQGLGIQEGVMPAMFGTIWIVVGAVTFAVPLAIGSAVFLTEYAEDSMFTKAVDIATNGLWSTPSIVFGLFGLAFIIPRFGDSPSILAAQLVLGFMLLPLVLITSREAMKSVPDEYRDASAALGVSKWQTIRSVVIPASMPGVITGVILGVGRIAGETAPLLLVLNGPAFPNSGPKILSSFFVRIGADPPFIHVSNPALMERASALPYQLYAVITAGVGAEQSFGWGTALVLLGVVLGFFALSITTRRYFRRKLHQ